MIESAEPMLQRVKSRMRRIFALLFILASVAVAASQEAPTIGTVYNTTEHHSISYECRALEPATLSCSFIQTVVRKKATPEQLDDKLAKARGQYAAAVEEFKKEAKTCQQVDMMLRVLDGQATPDEFAESLEAKDKEKAATGISRWVESSSKTPDDADMVRAIDRFCKQRDLDSFLNIGRTEYEREVRTCLVSSHEFKQTFAWQESFGDGKGAWLVTATPEGPCGIVQLSRFESQEGYGGYKLWRYIARKAVGNPEGMLLGQKCSELDEKQYVYDWQETLDTRMGCEFVKFSPF